MREIDKEFEQNADTFEVISIDSDKYNIKYQGEQIEKSLNETETQNENVSQQLLAEV